MIQSASHLASLIGSRICHDLISPIGAIHNGLELISLSGAVQHEAEISLITQSCQNAASRIKFFRVAFGVSGSDRQLSTDTLLDNPSKPHPPRSTSAFSGDFMHRNGLAAWRRNIGDRARPAVKR